MILRTLLPLAALALPSVCFAQPQSDEERTRLMRAATTARDAGDHATALRSARRAGEIRMTPSLRLFIAEEEETAGQLAAAYDDARACVSEVDASPPIQNAAGLRRDCEALSTRLARRLAFVTLTVPTVEGASVRVDGVALDRERWGRAITRGAGSVVVEAEAPGRRRFRREINLRAGVTERVAIALPAAESSAPSVATPEVPAQPETRSGPGAGPWVLVGVGAASLVASGVFFALRGGAISDRDTLCESSSGDCVTSDASAATRASDAQSNAVTFNTVSMVTLGVGAAAVAGGLIWWLAGRGSAPRERPRAALMFAPSVGGAVVGLSGSL